jgi:hypothetical protein
MSKITITEALQEIKTIGNRLNKKRDSVAAYVGRDARVLDPLMKDGGAPAFIAGERQAINDLEKRIVSIRTAIQRSNLASNLSIGQITKTVAEWLTWRREISKDQKTFLDHLVKGIAKIRTDTQMKGGRVVGTAVAITEGMGANDPPQIIINIDERELIRQQEELEETLGTLDGKLSLFNATTVIDV